MAEAAPSVRCFAAKDSLLSADRPRDGGPECGLEYGNGKTRGEAGGRAREDAWRRQPGSRAAGLSRRDGAKKFQEPPAVALLSLLLLPLPPPSRRAFSNFLLDAAAFVVVVMFGAFSRKNMVLLLQHQDRFDSRLRDSNHAGG